jgi:hypothetical protein
MSSFGDALRKNLTCPTCQNLFISPVIASCCNNTFCITCVGNLSRCPLHKKTCHFTPNRIVETMIEELPYDCICGESPLRKQREEHGKTCKKVIKNCSECRFQGNLEERIKHFLDVHLNLLIRDYAELV